MPRQNLNEIRYQNNDLYLEIALTRGEAHNRAAIINFLSRYYRAPANYTYRLFFKDQQGHYHQINPEGTLREAFASARAFLGGPRYVCLEVWTQCGSKASVETEMKTEMKSETFPFQ